MKALKTIRTLLILTLATAFTAVLPAQTTDNVKVKRIWDQGDHNAFTDLILFKGRFYCTFREGTGHVGGNGTIRILTSANGEDWESLASLEKEGIDLRDPKISITPAGRLMIIMGGTVLDNGNIIDRFPHVSFSDAAGLKFSAPEKTVIDAKIASRDWIWRVTWYKGTGYAIDYQIMPYEKGKPGQVFKALYLLKTRDGIHYDEVCKLDIDGFPSEGTVQFDKHGRMYAVIRRDQGDRFAVMGSSPAPYNKWDFKKLDFRIGGPHFVFAYPGKIIVAGRIYEPKSHTSVLLGNTDGELTETIRLPSSGDNSYPGLVIDKETLWISYYSSHEGKTSIYLARMPLTQLFPAGK